MQQSYRVGRFDVIPGERQVRSQGRPVSLGARAFDLLLALIESQGQPVAKQALMDKVWPGVVVEENNLTVQVSALRKLLGAGAVATIPGRGYQLALDVEQAPAAPARSTGLPLPDKPSIAVLPFEDLSAGGDQQFFVDGITEDITTELSRFHGLFVIARSSAFTYRGKAADVREIARELGVRYVVVGSVRRESDRARISARLVDGDSGAQLWAERYDRQVGEIFAVQQEVTEAIVASVAPRIETSFTQPVRTRHGAALSAYEMGMKAWLLGYDSFTRSGRGLRDEALALAREALALDPDCLPAWRAIARAQFYHLYMGTAASPEAARQEARQAAHRALAIDPNDHSALMIKGMLLYGAGQPEAAMVDMRRAHELNPNDALILSALGFYEAVVGNTTLGIDHATRALRLSPRDPRRPMMLNLKGWTHFAAEDHAAAAEAAQMAISEAPELPAAQLCLTVNLAALGRVDEARRQFRILAELAPELAAARLAGDWLPLDQTYARRATKLLRLAAGT